MFETALQSLPQFIQEMDADWEMVFDWMEDQCGALSEEQLNEVAMIFDTTLLWVVYSFFLHYFTETHAQQFAQRFLRSVSHLL